MDKQDGQDSGLKHGQITKSVIGCAFEVINHPVKVLLRGECVGDFYADLFVELILCILSIHVK